MARGRVLVVDDYEPFRRLIRSMLEGSSFRIVGEASGGLEAVQKAHELQPDLILLDIGLPQLNGIEAAKRISQVAPDAKILFVSQETSSDVVEAALSLGALGYVFKSHIQTDLPPAIESVQQLVGSGLEVRDFTDKGQGQIPNRHTPYRFEFDSTNSILQGHLAGFVSAQDVRNFYGAAAKHVARLSPRNYVLDVSAVTSTTISTDTIRAFAKLSPIPPDRERPRFIVASRPAVFWLMRMYELAGRATRPNLHVVRKHAEAWAILGIPEPRFNPL